MTNNRTSIDELRDSFNRVYHGPDRLRREYELVMEAERLGVPLDTYRRLYELRGEEAIDPYPKPKKWWHTPGDWGKWVWHLPPKKKIALGRKGLVKLVQSGVLLTVAIALGRYVWEAPKREKLAHYQAWQMINSAAGQKTNGGRIDALQDLNKDGVSLAGLDASGANLDGINLQKANLKRANLNKANLNKANLGGVILIRADLAGADLVNAILSGADLFGANLSDADLVNANLADTNLMSANLSNADLVNAMLSGANLSNAILTNANFSDANLSGVILVYANLSNANLSNADLSDADLSEANLGCLTITINNKTYCTNLKGAKNITPEQIKKAKNWQEACYDPEFRKKLGLPLQNPFNCAVKGEYDPVIVEFE